MNESETASSAEQLRSALEGNPDALGALLETHRAYLKILARRYVDGRMGARLDESDLAQQTCLSALRHFGEFRGDSLGEFVAWLRKIHERKIQNSYRRHLGTGKRSIEHEQRLNEIDPIVTDSLSPSQRAMQSEAAVELARALEQLPDEQREAVRLRYLEGLSMEQIGQALGKSRDAVVGLVKRGILNLRKHLQ
jgi:RNA polymerase sigma-70 factor (ECF subfamily)